MIRKLGIVAALVFALVTAACAAFYFYTDRKVARRLQALTTGDTPAVYSAPLPVSLRADPASVLKFLRNELSARGYAEVETPASPGEYKVKGREVRVVTRPFVDPERGPVESADVTAHLDLGESTESGSLNPAVLILEPRVLSYLGSAEVRASKYKSLEEIPEQVQKAVLAVEDQRFYDHFGLDLIGITRAIAKNVMAGALKEGGSTLTQQLAKNLFLTPERSLSRKFNELFAAVSLERRLSKKQILELYLNEVYLGQEGAVAVHGVAEASKSFFGKELSALSLSEAATLAGIIRAPSFYSPRRHVARAKNRRDVALKRMVEAGFITQADADTAALAKLKIAEQPEYGRVAPHFLATLQKQLSEVVEGSAGKLGVKAYTGIDLTFQNCAERAISQGLHELEKNYGKVKRQAKPLEAALVALEPHSGMVKAWVGGRDYALNQFDHVSQAQRQIGSTIKPFLYLTALDGKRNAYKVATAISILEDRPIAVGQDRRPSWEPENYDHDYRGDVTLRYSLEQSLNMPAVYVAERVGIDRVRRTAEDFRLADVVPEVPALALGAVETTLLRLTAAYGALANGGVYVEPRLYSFVRDENGSDLARTEFREFPVGDEGSVFVLTDMLQGVVDRGTAKVLRKMGFTRPVAGKTGTSNEARDAWFVGFVPTLVAGVWVGFDDNAKVGLTGGSAAAPIWTRFMKCVEPGLPNIGFVAPASVEYHDVDVDSQSLAGPDCPGRAIREVFVRGTEPAVECESAGRRRDPFATSDIPERPRRRKERSFWDEIFG